MKLLVEDTVIEIDKAEIELARKSVSRYLHMMKDVSIEHKQLSYFYTCLFVMDLMINDIIDASDVELIKRLYPQKRNR